MCAVNAAACASICSTETLYGFGENGVSGCTCSGSGASRTGSGGCQCGPCYTKQSDGTVIGFALQNGLCVYGTNCGTLARSLVIVVDLRYCWIGLLTGSRASVLLCLLVACNCS